MNTEDLSSAALQAIGSALSLFGKAEAGTIVMGVEAVYHQWVSGTTGVISPDDAIHKIRLVEAEFSAMFKTWDVRAAAKFGTIVPPDDPSDPNV